jgi:UDP-N-acetylmuramoylalanine--D-glutamate ligase
LKPFDCVGTFEEMRAAFWMARNNFKNDLAIKTFLPKIKNGDALLKKVFRTTPSPTVPAKFQFLGMKKALILGYAREGKVTHEYLKKNYPNLEIGIADMSDGKNYLDKQNGFDIAIKTPGINKSLVKIPYTTATNIFLSQVQGTLTIGITGSKGKSTTTSLIYSILKETGKQVHLLGNIGYPMLEALLGKIGRDDIFVLELSSYQLDDIKFSPNIAVATNLFPEHMDFHGGVREYYGAKKNIVAHQKEGDFFVYNSGIKDFRKWETPAKKIPSDKKLAFKGWDIPLLGEHNRSNLQLAYAVAKILKIPDSTIQRAVAKFKPLEHRLEFVGEFKGIRFYNDALSTAPESTIEAIKAIPNIGTIFLGGEDRGYDFSELRKVLKKYRIKNIVLFPDSGKRILESQNGLNIIETRSMKEAVAFGYKYTKKGQACLLSTASPSYGVWKNYEEKGGEFKREVGSRRS